MKFIITDYRMGYDSGYADGRSDGRSEGWVEAASEYNERIRRLNVEIKTLEARLAVLERQS